MNKPNDRSYYRERADICRRLAAQATLPEIVAVHQDFARRYEELAEPPRPVARVTR